MIVNRSVVIEFVISFAIINPKRYQGSPTLKEKKKFVLVSSVASYKFYISGLELGLNRTGTTAR